MFEKALLHFKKVDPILYSASVKNVPFVLEKRSDHFLSLNREIIGQQLSGKVADVIFGRFMGLFPKKKVTPGHLLTLSDEAIRQIGTSWSKVTFLKDLAQRIVNRQLVLEELESLSDEEVKDRLSEVKGIGPWTVEMFLMFSLGRQDVFSFGDLGLKEAIKRLYNLESRPDREYLEKLSSIWSPYRTYAARILWRSLEI